MCACAEFINMQIPMKTETILKMRVLDIVKNEDKLIMFKGHFKSPLIDQFIFAHMHSLLLPTTSSLTQQVFRKAYYEPGAKLTLGM